MVAETRQFSAETKEIIRIIKVSINRHAQNTQGREGRKREFEESQFAARLKFFFFRCYSAAVLNIHIDIYNNSSIRPLTCPI